MVYGRLDARELGRQASHIRRGIADRDDGAIRAPWDTKWGYLKCRVYALTRRLLAEDRAQIIEQLVRSYSKEPRGVPFAQNPFYWALIAIDAPRFRMIKRADRRRFANELLVAHQNDVPAMFLVGFLYQLGSAEDIHARAARGGRSRMMRQLSRLEAPQ
jgi:hypothetical protein